MVAAALGFGPGWQQLGLPHPVPIACVGCGACDSELLQAIAKITNGMFVIVGNVSELSTFFRRQVSYTHVIEILLLLRKLFLYVGSSHSFCNAVCSR